jgi:hypothetical protein
MPALHSGTYTDPLQQRIAAHLADVVAHTPLGHAPFDHLVLTGVWPDDVYPQLLHLLPPDSYYRELKHSDAMLPDGRSARLQFPLVAENIARLPDGMRQFWASVAAAVKSAAVENAYKTKFAETLTRVTGKSAGAIRLRPYATLFRDIGGYKISIHPDSPRKAMTTQFYLPADDSQVHLGTLFHSRSADGSFDAGRAMRFAPNSGYAFAVCPESYHSVNPMRPDDKPRNSLMIIINYDRGPLVEGFKAARNKLRGWYDRARGKTGGPEEGEGKYETM